MSADLFARPQPTLFDPQIGPWHRDDPDTSRDAGVGQYHGSVKQRERVLRALYLAGHRGATDYELMQLADIRLRTSAGTRRKMLERQGFCFETTDKRPTDTGKSAHVHRITPEGIEQYRLKLRDAK